MKTSKYDFLKKYYPEKYNKKQALKQPYNLFYPISKQRLEYAEHILGFKIPSELREFYINLGAGEIMLPELPPKDYKFYGANMILPPDAAAYFYCALRDGRYEEDFHFEDLDKNFINFEKSYFMSCDTMTMMQKGDLPFFEIGDSTRFLFLKPHYKNNDAVYAPGNIKIEDSFERFIHRLYYQDPSYYDDVIEEHYMKEKSG